MTAHAHGTHHGDRPHHAPHAAHRAGRHEHAGGHVHGREVDERNVASGTIKSIGDTTLVLATEEGDLTVITGAGTNFHGLSRRQAREAGYQDPTAINSFAALRIGQRVSVMGERPDEATLRATRVHVSEP